MSTSSNMSARTSDRGARLADLGREIANIDAAVIAFEATGKIQVPTSNASMTFVVTMTVTTDEGREQVLAMLARFREQVEEEIRGVLGPQREARHG